jgi:hypothetical protein
MSHPSKSTPGAAGNEAARDIHARIKEQAERLASAPRPGIRDPDELPEIKALLVAAHDAITRALPSAFQFAGRTYWLSSRLACELYVFDEPAAGRPLVSGLQVSHSLRGHKPAH